MKGYGHLRYDSILTPSKTSLSSLRLRDVAYMLRDSETGPSSTFSNGGCRSDSRLGGWILISRPYAFIHICS